MTNGLKGAGFALLGFALFSTHDAIIKTLGGALSPFQIIFFGQLFGFPLVTVMLMRDRTDGNLRPRHPGWIAVRTAAGVLGGAAGFYAFTVLPMAQTYAILFASPLLITLLAIPILGERVRLRRGLAVIVGLVGVIVVIRPGQASLSLGHLAALTAAVCGALASIIVRKIGQDERSAVLLLYPMMANVIVMGALLPFVYVPIEGWQLTGLAGIALLAFVAMLAIIAAYRRAEAALVAPMQYSQILWAAIYGLIFFHEPPTLNTALGAGIIIASGLYIVFREQAPGASRNRPVRQTRSRPDFGVVPKILELLRRREPGLH